MIWKFRDREFLLNSPKIVGVVNVTPDSFSDGALFLDPEKAVDHACRLVAEGADILDIGAESTRPNAPEVSAEEETHRLLPVLTKLRDQVDVPISIDTTKPEVACACLEEGADIINDVSGLKDSGDAMAALALKYEAGLILMHRRGNSQTMQSMTDYDDLIPDVVEELRDSINRALQMGVGEERIVIDPGIGFAKDAAQNFELIRRIEEFQRLGYPVLLGPSRKSFLGSVTGKPANEREFATAAVVAFATLKNIPLIRVHNAGAMKDVLITLQAIVGEGHVGTFKVE